MLVVVGELFCAKKLTAKLFFADVCNIFLSLSFEESCAVIVIKFFSVSIPAITQCFHTVPTGRILKIGFCTYSVVKPE